MNRLHYQSAALGFLDPRREGASEHERAKAVVIPFGLEQTVTYQTGTARGPQAILEASHEVELFDEELWQEPYRQYGVATLVPPSIAPNIDGALQQLEVMVASVLAHEKFPLVLGGEHAITAGAIRPFADRYGDLVVLQFDAHADLRPSYLGQHFSHASAMARVLDHPSISLIGVGLRNISAEELPILEKNTHRISHYWAQNKQTWDIHELAEKLRGRPVYISFDLDCFDSSLMPATGTPEPGGLFWYEALEILQAACAVSDVVGADIVELSPRPGLHACDFLAAKLAYKILTYALCDTESTV